MKFKKKDLLRVVESGTKGYESGGLKFVEQSGWKDEGKYSYRETIFEVDGRFFMISESSTGSYYTDYYYDRDDWADDVECPEAEPVQVTVTTWKVKQ